MYLIPIHVPLYKQGNDLLVDLPWKRSLELLRDSFGGALGQLTVLAPWLPASEQTSQQMEVISSKRDGIDAVASFDARCRARSYWVHERRRWQADLRRLLVNAKVVHAGMDDLYRPIAFAGTVEAIRAGVPNVFVQDMDIALRVREIASTRGLAERSRALAYSWLYTKACRWAVARADLSLLKGDSVMNRYASYARFARSFHDTSHSLADTITHAMLAERLTKPRSPRQLRLVYCGRLVTSKGLRESLAIVGGARRAGADVTLDIIGDGPDREPLEKVAADSATGAKARFLGTRPYGPPLLRELASYDAMVFTPPGDETPRMIFDGFAAGLPLVAFDTAYARQLSDEDKCCILLPRGDIQASAHRLAAAAADFPTLAALSHRAAVAGRNHAVETWYKRRADWTLEALNRRNR